MATHDLSAHAHHTDESVHNRSGERRTAYVVALTAVMMIGELIVGPVLSRSLLHSDSPQPDARFSKQIVDSVLDGIVAPSS